MKKIPFLDLKPQHQSIRKELMEAFDIALRNTTFIGGDAVRNFEEHFAKYIGVKGCSGVSNGTDSLRLSLQAAGIGDGDEVVTVPNTFIATTEAISQSGASIAFVDVERDTCLMDPNRLESFLEKKFDGKQNKIKAIIPVHLYGQCADMDSINELAKKYGLVVIEDAAQAHGAEYKGKKAGSMGDLGSFSFYPGKNLGACGDGGAVVSNRVDFIETINILKDHGQVKKYHHEIEGCNNRLDAIQAQFLSIKLPHLDGWNKMRRAIAQKYNAAFCNIKGLTLIKERAHNKSSHHLYIVHVEDRDTFCKYLDTNGIGFGFHYPKPLHLQSCYSGLGFSLGDFPISEWSATSLVSLPMYPELHSDEQEYIIDRIVNYFV